MTSILLQQARLIVRDPRRLDEILRQYRDPKAVAAVLGDVPPLSEEAWQDRDERTAISMAYTLIAEPLFANAEIQSDFIGRVGERAFAEIVLQRALPVAGIGLPSQAIEYVDRALALLPTEGGTFDDAMLVAKARAIRADCLRDMKAFEDALLEYAAAIDARLPHVRNDSDSSLIESVAGNFINRGNLYNELDEAPAAMLAYSQARQLFEILVARNDKTSDQARDNSSGCLLNIGLVLRSIDHYNDALMYFSEAVAVRETLPFRFRGSLANALVNRADTYVSLRQYNLAAADLERAMPICKELSETYPSSQNFAQLALAVSGRGRLYLNTERYEESERDYTETIALYARLADVGDRENRQDRIADAYSGFASTYLLRGLPEKAAECFRRAVDLVDSRIDGKLTERDRSALVARHAGTYAGLVAAYAMSGDGSAANALYWGERARARNFGYARQEEIRPPRFIAETRFRAYLATLGQLRSSERNLRRAHFELITPQQTPASVGELHNYEQERQQLLRLAASEVAAFQAVDPTWSSSPAPLTAAEIAELARILDSHLLSLTIEASGVAAAVVTPAGDMHARFFRQMTLQRAHDLVTGVQFGVEQDSWTQAYGAFRQEPNDPAANERWVRVVDHVTRRFGEELWLPLRDWLSEYGLGGDRRSLVVAAGQLFSVLPLEAFCWTIDGHAMTVQDELDIAFVPNFRAAAESLRRLRPAVHRAMHSLVARDPARAYAKFALRGADAEALAIRRLFNDVTVLGDGSTPGDGAATREALLRALAEFDIVVLATHGMFDPTSPWTGSGLYTADRLDATGKPQLTVGDIFNMSSCDARLVVLSACESGLVDVRDTTSEHIGLPTALLSAGAAAVIASRWLVDDEATSLIIGRVLHELLADERPLLSTARALTRAKQWLRDVPSYRQTDISSAFSAFGIW